MYLVSVVQVGRSLRVIIPRAIERELGIVKRMVMVLERGPDRTIVLRKLEDHFANREPSRTDRALAHRPPAPSEPA